LVVVIWGKMTSTKNFDVNITFDGRDWITGKPRGDQKMIIISFAELLIFLGLVGLSAPGGSYCCSWSIVGQNHDSHYLSGNESSRDVSLT
jgi:hypothetical protein